MSKSVCVVRKRKKPKPEGDLMIRMASISVRRMSVVYGRSVLSALMM